MQFSVQRIQEGWLGQDEVFMFWSLKQRHIVENNLQNLDTILINFIFNLIGLLSIALFPNQSSVK